MWENLTATVNLQDYDYKHAQFINGKTILFNNFSSLLTKLMKDISNEISLMKDHQFNMDIFLMKKWEQLLLKFFF